MKRGLNRHELHTILDDFEPGLDKYKGDSIKWHDHIDVIWQKNLSLVKKVETENLKLTPASAYRRLKTTWGWKDRFPTGELILIPGKIGSGKTTFSAWLAANLTRGTLPGDFYGTPRNVIYTTREDVWEYTITKRLVAAGADMDMVMNLEAKDGHLYFPDRCEELAELAKEVEAAAVIFDPIVSYVDPSKNVNHGRQLRDALEPLVLQMQNVNAMTIGLAHFNKNVDALDAIQKISGSTVWAELPRAIFAIHDNEDHSVGSQLKNSRGPLGPNLVLNIEIVSVDTESGPDDVPRISIGEETDTSVEELMMEKRSRGREVGDKMMLIVDYVKEGGRRQTSAEICNFFSYIKPGTVRKYLKRAEENGLLARPGYGIYAPPYTIEENLEEEL